MSDPTEQVRRTMVGEINAKEAERKVLEDEHGQIWDTTELQKDFYVNGFGAPFISVERKSDGKKGSLVFQHSPRYYWGFTEA